MKDPGNKDTRNMLYPRVLCYLTHHNLYPSHKAIDFSLTLQSRLDDYTSGFQSWNNLFTLLTRYSSECSYQGLLMHITIRNRDYNDYNKEKEDMRNFMDPEN